MRKLTSALSLGAAAVLSLSLAACATSDPAANRARESATRVKGLAGPSLDLTIERCTACHDFGKVEHEMLDEKPSRDEWWAIVDDMAGRRGSPIKQSEINTIVNVLEKLQAAQGMGN